MAIFVVGRWPESRCEKCDSTGLIDDFIPAQVSGYGQI